MSGMREAAVERTTRSLACRICALRGTPACEQCPTRSKRARTIIAAPWRRWPLPVAITGAIVSLVLIAANVAAAAASN